MGMYRYLATSITGFVQQLAVSYLRHGYWFYVTGRIPKGKDPFAVDAKLIETYGIDRTKWARAWAKTRGVAGIQYLRHESFFVLVATHGEHLFFEREKGSIRDAREVPIRYAGYAMSYRGGHPHVRIEHGDYLMLRAWFELQAIRRDAASLGRALQQVPYEPYAPVKRQLFNVLRGMNRLRRSAGLEPVGNEWLQLTRRIVHPFGPAEWPAVAAAEAAMTPSEETGGWGDQSDALQTPGTLVISPASDVQKPWTEGGAYDFGYDAQYEATSQKDDGSLAEFRMPSTLSDRFLLDVPENHPEPPEMRQEFPDLEPWMDEVRRDLDRGPNDEPDPPRPKGTKRTDRGRGGGGRGR